MEAKNSPRLLLVVEGQLLKGTIFGDPWRSVLVFAMNIINSSRFLNMFAEGATYIFFVN